MLPKGANEPRSHRPGILVAPRVAHPMHESREAVEEQQARDRAEYGAERVLSFERRGEHAGVQNEKWKRCPRQDRLREPRRAESRFGENGGWSRRGHASTMAPCGAGVNPLVRGPTRGSDTSVSIEARTEPSAQIPSRPARRIPYTREMDERVSRGRVLLTGATGFVGSHLLVLLEAAGFEVRCASRSPEKHAGDGRSWVACDVESGDGLDAALDSCDAAYYLVHSMAGGSGYAERERESALKFREAAAAANVRRIVYLGGVSPGGSQSRHLESRLLTGRLLREGSVPCIELRAAMIVGAGSESWLIVRDLARRLPVMVLPSWLHNRSCPVFIDDLLFALLRCLDIEVGGAAVFEAPGPTCLSHKELLQHVARQANGRAPLMIDVPVLSPALSSLWIGLISNANLNVARELVHGLVSDLVPTGQEIWGWMPDAERTPLDQAIALALQDDGEKRFPTEASRVRLLRRLAEAERSSS